MFQLVDLCVVFAATGKYLSFNCIFINIHIVFPLFSFAYSELISFLVPDGLVDVRRSKT